jgi:hypothetical protein
MGVKIFNAVSVSAVVAIIVLFTTLWNLQARPDYFPDDLIHQVPHEADGTASKVEPTPSPSPTIIKEPEPTGTRPSWREIAFKYVTDKVTTHHYQYSKYYPF